MPGGRRARRYSRRFPLEAYSTITYRGPWGERTTGKARSGRLILNFFFFFFNVKKLLVRYNNLTESIKWESGKHGFKRK